MIWERNKIEKETELQSDSIFVNSTVYVTMQVIRRCLGMHYSTNGGKESSHKILSLSMLYVLLVEKRIQPSGYYFLSSKNIGMSNNQCLN